MKDNKIKDNKIKDERILQERRKIQSTAYSWIIIALLISVVVQQFFMKAPFAQYAVEFFIVIGSGFYMMLSHLEKGIDIWNPEGYGKKKILLNTFISGILAVVLMAFLSGKVDMKNLPGFVLFLVLFCATRLIVIRISHKKQQSLDRKLDEEEQEE